MMYSIERYLRAHSATGMVWLNNHSLAYLANISGSTQVWRVPAAGGYPEQLTYYSERITGIYAPSEQGFFFSKDTGGNENAQLFSYLYDGSDPADITHNPAAMHQFAGRVGSRVLYACNGRNPAHFDLCAVDACGQEHILVHNEDNYNTPAGISPSGRYVLYNKMRGQEDNALWFYDLTQHRTQQVGHGAFPVVTSPQWCADSNSFYCLTHAGGDFTYIAHYDIKRNLMRTIHSESWDVENLRLSPDGQYLAFSVNVDGYSQLRLLHIASRCVQDVPLQQPTLVLSPGGIAWSPDSTRLALNLSVGCRPLDIFMYTLGHKCLQQVTYSSYCGLQEDAFVVPELHRFASFDGLEVPVWIYRPLNAPPGPLPVVISIHGGPESQERPGFNPVLQYFINQGIAVAAPNVRGSTGYGRAYGHLDDIEKRMDSVADINALVAFLSASGIADAKRIAVMGGSYGGFMTLASITEYPHLWAAAVDTVGIANFETFMENTSSYRRAHRASEYGNLEQHRDILRRVSPIHKVDAITAPLMVIHGANDPRVPIGEAEQIVAHQRERGREVLYLRYEDEGHGIAKLHNRLDCYPQVAAFLKEKLGIN